MTASCAVVPTQRKAQREVSRRSSARSTSPAARTPQRSASGRAAGATVRPTAYPQVRLTRRGRLVVAVAIAAGLVVVLLGLAALLLGPAATPAAASSHAQHPSATTVVVQPGQTLWSIARQVAPNRDPREVVTALREVNNLPSPAVFAGDHLVIPAGL